MKWPTPIYVVEAKRTPIGRFCGGLKEMSPVELALAVAQTVMPDELGGQVDEVILGQVLQAGSGMNVARQLVLQLGLAQSVTGFTVNMVCASGMKAVALGADAIASGQSSVVLAGGVESMSRAPHYARNVREGTKLGHATLEDSIFVDGLTDPILKVGMGETAERIVDACGITREAQDVFAMTSQERAAAAVEAFQREIVPVETKAGMITHDEHPRADTTPEKLAKLKPAFRKDGTVTAGNASGVNDGAALLLLASEEAVQKYELQPRARLIAGVSTGCEPATMGLGPVSAVQKLLKETGWSMDQVDAMEINEAFAAQTLACAEQLGVDRAKLNRRGGAIALGHPVGCSGARVLVTLLHILEDEELKRGVATLCAGGGMGIAMAMERVE
ncbi:acetyl-CoA acetyltransferase [Roseimicrobium gellanilyticum]|uniref:Acetyl-CoA acetyltransferase n=1 Tax=Roseimicrobium gellanilyticum TaxID=748857 RepID=A0A366HT54_9BACT|nr:thiolase family protein [Roseimicrobium gellanilyticum]RBP47267.1 acetyl-CoA acetyltransferase [Roseimicrobium gellanilyticum]